MEKPDTIVVHFSEIALKGQNRGEFENALVKNIGYVLEKGNAGISRTESRLIIKVPDVTPSILELLGNVFGISWFSPAYIIEKNLGKITERVIECCVSLKGKRLKLETSRTDKNFPLNSVEINKAIGQELEKQGHLIDVKNPEKRIFIEILKNNAIVLYDRHEGSGGLPVGTAGRVLVLLSGGIDSPVAAWLMMKRGCEVDFLHVHSGTGSEAALESKIPRIASKLKGFHPGKCRLFIAPYTEFYKRSMDMDPKIELVVFRRFMLRLADWIAKENKHLGIVTGDNISQVASQTLENLFAVNDTTAIPIYRPLATYDKQEIVDLAKRIGTYRLSIEEYKDCCSLVAAKHPSTRVRPEKARDAEKKIGMQGLLEKTIEQMEIIEV